MSEEEINYEQNKIVQLRQQSRGLILPRRSIAYQFQNMRYGNRDTSQQIAVRRKARKKIGTEIKKSRDRLTSLRSALLG